MLLKVLISVLVTLLVAAAASSEGFVFHGFQGADLSLNGVADIEPNGLLRLTNDTKQAIGHAFFPSPLHIVNSSDGKPVSFSTSFVFAIVPEYPDVSAHGLAFAISPSKSLAGAQPSQHLGLFNLTNNGNSSNHILAVELDTVQTTEYNDIDDNHVGIDVNSLCSINSAPASYFTSSTGGIKNLTLISGEPMQLWVEYNGDEMRLNVTLSPINVAKPHIPLLSSKVNLSLFTDDEMYVGFSSSTGGATGNHYVLGWSFSLNGKAQEIDISKLPSLPSTEGIQKQHPVLPILLGIAVALLIVVAVVGLVIYRKRRFSEECEDWEIEYGPHRFSYKDLYRATKGFNDANLLGSGGFGGVYKGLLPKSQLEIAVKRVSNESRQGLKEFVAEIASIGRVRHRNLVRLLGYSRRHGELLLVYEFMPGGSLDKYLFGRPEVILNWTQRFRIVKGIAAGLLYLHEEWEQVIIHRDIKASNVLLDKDFNGRLGDFGLARLYDRGIDPQTTHVVGTLGYLAPETPRTAKATTSSDVYAFGAFLLEVACGKRPIELKTSGVELVLVDWVLGFWKRGAIVEARDRRLRDVFVMEELELVLKLGLVCSHPAPSARPTMRQVVQYLEGDAVLPAMSEDDLHLFEAISQRERVLDVNNGSHQSISRTVEAYPFSVSDTLFSKGR